jgi:TatA/E family protein of Tat protein translocase
MFGLQPIHLIAILVIALLIFGPKPISNLIRSFRKAGEEFHEEVKSEDKNGKASKEAGSKPRV